MPVKFQSDPNILNTNIAASRSYHNLIGYWNRTQLLPNRYLHRNIPKMIGLRHICWWSCSMREQIINSNVINHARRTGYFLPCTNIPASSQNRKYTYMFMYPGINSTLSITCVTSVLSNTESSYCHSVHGCWRTVPLISTEHLQGSLLVTLLLPDAFVPVGRKMIKYVLKLFLDTVF